MSWSTAGSPGLGPSRLAGRAASHVDLWLIHQQHVVSWRRGWLFHFCLSRTQTVAKTVKKYLNKGTCAQAQAEGSGLGDSCLGISAIQRVLVSEAQTQCEGSAGLCWMHLELESAHVQYPWLTYPAGSAMMGPISQGPERV